MREEREKSKEENHKWLIKQEQEKRVREKLNLKKWREKKANKKELRTEREKQFAEAELKDFSNNSDKQTNDQDLGSTDKEYLIKKISKSTRISKSYSYLSINYLIKKELSRYYSLQKEDKKYIYDEVKKLLKEKTKSEKKKNKKRKKDPLKASIEDQLKRKRLAENRKPQAELFLNKIKEIIEENKYNLLLERKKLIFKDPYGNEDNSDWICDPMPNPEEIIKILASNEVDASSSINQNFKKGIPYFWLSSILPAVGGKKRHVKNAMIFFDEYKNVCDYFPSIKRLNGKTKVRKLTDWYLDIVTMVENACKSISDSESQYSSNDGIVFEQDCKKILEIEGWIVEDTSISGDQGVDLIASNEKLRVCIQCKCFDKPVGNKAVQEITAGKIHYRGTHAVVVSKSGFTKSARQLADSTNVVLINEFELDDLVNRFE
tara:strand:+ start:435 stop:1733 length:1299 start_codon:yes stop_codon:yes gene_type:complete